MTEWLQLRPWQHGINFFLTVSVCVRVCMYVCAFLCVCMSVCVHVSESEIVCVRVCMYVRFCVYV